jgi:hypothetical protein
MKINRVKGFAGVLSILTIAVSLVVIFGLAKAVTSLVSNAAAPTAQISFFPPAPIFNATTKQQNVTVNVNVGANKVGFTKVVVLFDKSKLALSGEITPAASLKTIVSQTTKADANATGQIEVSLGLAVADKANAPTGVIPVMVIPFQTLVPTAPDTTVLAIDEANTQIVDLTPQNYAVTSVSSTVSLNPVVATPTPTASPIVVVPPPTIAPTATPIVTVAPTATPIKSVLPTATPIVTSVPTASPTTSPTVTPVSTVTPTKTPVATATPTIAPTAGPIVTKQVVWSIASAADIANEESGAVKSGKDMFVGSGKTPAQSYLGMKFTGAALPQGAQIVSAVVTFSPQADAWISTSFNIGAEKNLSPLAYTSTNKLSTRQRSLLIKYSDNVKWVTKNFYNYDVTNPLKEVMANAQNQTVVSFIAQGEGKAFARKFIATDSTYGPKLKITYTAPSTTAASGGIINAITTFVRSLFQ